MKSLGVERRASCRRRRCSGRRRSAVDLGRRSRSASSGDWRVLPSWSSRIARTPVPVSAPVAVDALVGAVSRSTPAGPRRPPPRRTRRRRGACGACGRGTCRARAGSCRRSPSRCSSTEHARARRVGALRDLGELERVAEQDQVARGGRHRERVGERDLAGLVDDEVVDRLVACPRGTTATRCPPSGRCRRGREGAALLSVLSISGSSSSRLERESRARVLLQAAEVDAASAGVLLDLVRAGCGSPCGCWRPRRRACRASSRLQDQLRAGVGLARAGRALDEEVAVVEAGDDPRRAARGRRRRPGAARRGATAVVSRQLARCRIARAARYGAGAVEAAVDDVGAELAQRVRCCSSVS